MRHTYLIAWPPPPFNNVVRAFFPLRQHLRAVWGVLAPDFALLARVLLPVPVFRLLLLLRGRRLDGCNAALRMPVLVAVDDDLLPRLHMPDLRRPLGEI